MLIEILVAIIKKIKSVPRGALFLFLVALGLGAAELVLRGFNQYVNYNPRSLGDIYEMVAATDAEYAVLAGKEQTPPPPYEGEDFSSLEEYRYIVTGPKDYIYGLKLPAHCNCRDVFKSHGRLIWDSRYHTDELGRRIVPSAPVKATRFIVAYGGSRTFGQGVEDAEALPNQLQLLFPDLHVYNYGIPGAGPNLFLKMHEDHVFQAQIPEPRGLFLFFFDVGHFQRLLGLASVPWSYNMPYYDFRPGEEIEYRGNFFRGRPVRSILNTLAAHSALYQKLFISQQLKYNFSPHETELIQKVFLKMQKEAAAFGSSSFAVVFNEALTSVAQTAVQKALRDSGIEVLVYSPAVLAPVRNDYFQYDMHPQPAVYRFEAALLARDLKEKKLVPVH